MGDLKAISDDRFRRDIDNKWDEKVGWWDCRVKLFNVYLIFLIFRCIEMKMVSWLWKKGDKKEEEEVDED